VAFQIQAGSQSLRRIKIERRDKGITDLGDGNKNLESWDNSVNLNC